MGRGQEIFDEFKKNHDEMNDSYKRIIKEMEEREGIIKKIAQKEVQIVQRLSRMSKEELTTTLRTFPELSKYIRR